MQSTDIDINASNQALSGMTAQERMGWVLRNYPENAVVSTSFGIQSAVTLHLATSVQPDMPIIFVDTGYLFDETYSFAEQLTKRLKLNLKVYTPLMTPARQEAIFGKRWELGEQGLKEYGLMNKVEPMNRAIQETGAKVWITGLRRDQSGTRKDLDFITKQNKIAKFHPILDWSNKDVYQYLKEYDLPYHPLWEKGYVSVGDWHSSKPLTAGMTEEQTRFNGIKRECGLHEQSGERDWVI
jgi:phosphoadenosine phosphosulfate reductase